MPDTDKVHTKLAGIYQKPYKELCEARHDAEFVANKLIRSLKESLQYYGNEPIQLLGRVADQLAQLPSEPLLKRTVDWAEETRKISKLGHRSSSSRGASKRGLDLAIRASNQVLQKIECGESPENIRFMLMREYLCCALSADFLERLALTQNHNNASKDLVEARLREMQPHNESGINYLAKQILRSNRVTKLRIRRRQQRKSSIDLHENLL